MKYTGKLYGKGHGKTYFPLVLTADDVDRIEKERDDLRTAIEKIKANAIAIQKIRYGWDGDCGATRLAEFIEEDCDLVLIKSPAADSASD